MIDKFLENKNKIKELEEENYEIMKRLFIKHENKIAEKQGDGVVNIKDQNFNLKFTKRSTYNVDQKTAKNHPNFFNVKYNFSKTLYDELSEIDRKFVDTMVTAKPAKPSLSIEVAYE